jgi:hypothetical protein
MHQKDRMQYAHSLFQAHGDKAEAEAAHRAVMARHKGKPDDAETWDKIRAHIRELRGAHQG